MPVRMSPLPPFAMAGDIAEVGIITQGGLYNTVIRALQHYGLADNDGNSISPNPTTKSFVNTLGGYVATFATEPAGASLYRNTAGAGLVQDGVLKLTPNVNSTQGAMVINELTPDLAQFEKIKKRLLFSLTNFGKPWIYVVDGNYRNRGELLLRHEHNGLDLKLDKAADTLANVQAIWSRPVHLQTVVDNQPHLMSHDGTPTVAYWAHIGGFVTGFVLTFLFRGAAGAVDLNH